MIRKLEVIEGACAVPEDREPHVPSRAIVVVVSKIPHLLYHHGSGAEYFVEGVGPDEAARSFVGEDCADGVYVWSGEIVGRRDYWGEYDEEVTGEHRPVTAEEWRGFCSDEHVWDQGAVEERDAWRAKKKLG